MDSVSLQNISIINQHQINKWDDKHLNVFINEYLSNSFLRDFCVISVWYLCDFLRLFRIISDHFFITVLEDCWVFFTTIQVTNHSNYSDRRFLRMGMLRGFLLNHYLEEDRTGFGWLEFGEEAALDNWIPVLKQGDAQLDGFHEHVWG